MPGRPADAEWDGHAELAEISTGRKRDLRGLRSICPAWNRREAIGDDTEKRRGLRTIRRVVEVGDAMVVGWICQRIS